MNTNHTVSTTLNYQHILEQLNISLYGLEREKEEVLTYLKITELTTYDFERILCLVGPPGVGKKSLVYALAQAIGRRCVHIPIGISEVSASLSTYGKSKIGEIAGQIIHLMNQHRDQSILFLLEGIDFLSLTFQSKITYGFKEVLAITHDHALRMKHIESPLDFQRALFFATATDISKMSQDLLSQLEIIPMTGYNDEQKIAIAQQWIVPEEAKACGVQGQVDLSDDTLCEIIRRYTNEIGLHQLRAMIKKLCKGLVRELALSKGNDLPTPAPENLTSYLGYPLFEMRKARKENEVGVISTIGRSGGHGVIADLEVLLIEDSQPKIILTGNMDTLVREVVMVALSYLLSRATTFGIEKDFSKKYTIHVNMIPGGILKSGVSAGLPIVLALLSALTKKELRCDISALGEITLHGKVQKVIGVHEKILAASRMGITRIIFPKENLPEIERLPREMHREIELCGVDTVEEAVSYAFS